MSSALKQKLKAAQSKPAVLHPKPTAVKPSAPVQLVPPSNPPVVTSNNRIVLPGQGSVEPIDLDVDWATELMARTPVDEHGVRRQRPIRKNQLDAIKRALREGWFIWLGEVIHLTPDLIAINGQHRCLAVIQTGITIPNQLLCIVEHPDAYSIIDSHGAKRNYAQSRKMAGESAISNSVVSAIILEKCNFAPSRRSNYTVFEKGNVIEECGYVNELMELNRGTPPLPSGVLAVALRAMRQDKERGFAFFDAVRTTDYYLEAGLCPPGDRFAQPAQVLHQYLSVCRAKKGGFHGETNLKACIEKSIRAWNAWCEQRMVKSLPALTAHKKVDKDGKEIRRVMPSVGKPNWV